MAKNDLFRVSLVGGYNKADVQEYLKNLENEMESIKVLHQKEKADLLRRLESSGETDEGGKESEELRKELEEKERELEQVRLELAGKEQELLEKKGDSDSWKQPTEENREGWLLEENEKLREELREKCDQCEELKERLKAEYQEPASEDGYLDQKVIADIVNDARRNAELIREEARKEKEEILAAAREEAEAMKVKHAREIDNELVEKGIQLIAAKHKIAQYMKEVKFVQEGLYNVYSRMDRIVENMPARLDNYWDEDRMLEEAKEATGGEEDSGQEKKEGK